MLSRDRWPKVTGAAASANRGRDMVGAFLTASRGGDFTTLLALLDPDVVPRSGVWAPT
jgi:hypothetical protein